MLFNQKGGPRQAGHSFALSAVSLLRSDWGIWGRAECLPNYSFTVAALNLSVEGLWEAGSRCSGCRGPGRASGQRRGRLWSTVLCLVTVSGWCRQNFVFIQIKIIVNNFLNVRCCFRNDITSGISDHQTNTGIWKTDMPISVCLGVFSFWIYLHGCASPVFQLNIVCFSLWFVTFWQCKVY